MRCRICDDTFPYRPGNIQETYIPAYKLIVCTACYEASHEGWGAFAEPKILAHLNTKGWLPRDGNPPP